VLLVSDPMLAHEANRDAPQACDELTSFFQLNSCSNIDILLRGLIEVPLGSRASLAEVALPPQPQSHDGLDPFPPHAPALPAGPRAHRAFNLQARSESVI
jgi:hypothetical protein